MPATPHVIVVMGVAGSGKTTVAHALAHHYCYEFLDADDFHTDEAKAQMAAGVGLNDEQREPWMRVLERELRGRVERGHSLVLAFSALRAAHRQRLRETGIPIRFVFLHAPPPVIAARLAERADHFMPSQLLPKQFEDLQRPITEPDVIALHADCPQETVIAKAIAALETG